MEMIMTCLSGLSKKANQTYSFFLALLTIIAFNVSAQEVKDLNVLFIGNSYTYFNSVPEQFEFLAEKQNTNINVNVKLISRGGATLKSLWDQNTAIAEIKANKWDFVVLQEQSMLGSMIAFEGGRQRHIYSPDQFYLYSSKFIELIKSNGAKPILFMTWASDSAPEQQGLLTHSYTSIALKTDSLLAPVGISWKRLKESNFDGQLYYRDGSHPSPVGSYVVAATIFETIFNHVPNTTYKQITGAVLSATGAIESDVEQILVELDDKQAHQIHTAIKQSRNDLIRNAEKIVSQKPKPTYNLPVISPIESIDLNTLNGDWFGTTTYGLDTAGYKMSISSEQKEVDINIELYGPDGIVHMTASNAKLLDNKLVFIFLDRRNNEWQFEFNFDGKHLNGHAHSIIRNNHLYDNWTASKNQVQRNIDFALLKTFLEQGKPTLDKVNFVSDTLKYYQEYSDIIGKQYKPYEAILSRQAMGLKAQNNFSGAIKQMELTIAFYPLSISALDNLAETLRETGKLEQAQNIYQNAYTLAIQSNSDMAVRIKEKYDYYHSLLTASETQ